MCWCLSIIELKNARLNIEIRNWSISLFRYRRDQEIKIPAISQLFPLKSSFHHRHPMNEIKF